MAACHQCGSELPGGARFCPECGARVLVGVAEERKIISVLFADLVGSTAAASSRDPEDVRAVVQPQLGRMRTELERFGGTVEKYVGDAVMAVFGAPLAHEDDAERAVRAALAIRDALGDAVKVAVNTGEAVVSVAARPETGESIASGDVLNTTYRIEEACPPGAVFVGDATYRVTSEAIDYGERRLVSAKGKTEPLTVWEALRARGAPRALEERALAPLVGRREELSLVIDTLARAKRDRTVQLVTLVGPPGIGKSRLVWELERALADDPGLVMWRRGRCLPYGDGVMYWALGEMIKAQAQILETDDAEAAAFKLRRAVRDLVSDRAEAERVEASIRPLVGLAGARGATHGEEAYASWRRFFEALAEWGPLALVFEDVHWADEGVLGFIDHLVDWATGVPLVVLCTARPDIYSRRSAWGGRPNALTIALSPLSDAETQRLLELLLRQREPGVPPELQQALVGGAEGNPLYAEEFVRMLLERGLLYREDGGWRLRDGDLPVPESVQAIIAARLDTLPPDEKRLLQDAAAVGRVFWSGALAEIGGRARDEVILQLRVLEQKEFVRRNRNSSVAADDEYVFRHALVRDVAYRQIPRAVRSEKHQAVARWLTAVAAGRSDRVELLAHHLWKASALAREAGREDRKLSERAARALREAGERALALNAFEPAANYFHAALELTTDDSAEHPTLFFRHAKALYRTGQADLGLLEEARERLLARGDVDTAAECEAIIGDVHWRRGDRSDAFASLEHAIAMVAERPPSFAKAYALTTLSRMRNAADEPEAAIELGSEAIRIADQLELSELRVAVLITIGIARSLSGDAAGIGDLRRSVALAEQIDSPESVRAYYNLAAVLGARGELREAFAAHAAGREHAQRFGDAAWIAWYRAERVYEHYWNGRWKDALALVEDLIGQEPSSAPASVEFDASLVRAWIELARGDGSAATEAIDRAERFARAAPDPQNLYPALATRARVLLAADNVSDAGDAVDELLTAFARRPSLPSFWVVELAFALERLERGPESLAVIQAAERSTRWLDAAVAIVQGRLSDAATVCEDIGALPEEAYCRLAATARAGRREADVDRALAFFRGVGASAYAAEAEALVLLP